MMKAQFPARARLADFAFIKHELDTEKIER
jgi:hypothetical protein